MKISAKYINGTKVIQTKTMGRGVAATKNFKKGDVVEISPCILLDGHDGTRIQGTELKFYVFDAHLRTRASTVLALGHGSLFNHSRRRSNLTYTYDQGTNSMVFVALKDIKKGQQLFINYGYDPVNEHRRFLDRKETKELTPVLSTEVFALNTPGVQS